MSSRPSSRAAVTINTAGMSKLDVRKIQMLTRQREKLEDEAAALQREIDDMVRSITFPSTFRSLTFVLGLRNWRLLGCDVLAGLREVSRFLALFVHPLDTTLSFSVTASAALR